MGRASLMRRKNRLHHPEHVTIGAIMRGRFLEPKAVAAAKKWRKDQSGKREKVLTKDEIMSLRIPKGKE